MKICVLKSNMASDILSNIEEDVAKAKEEYKDVEESMQTPDQSPAPQVLLLERLEERESIVREEIRRVQRLIKFYSSHETGKPASSSPAGP